jgi:rare lipoprotein A
MVRRPQAAAPVAIVRADVGAAPGRAVTVAAIAAAVGIGVAIGCATEAGARGRAAPVGQVQEGHASYYGRSFAGRRTASGERYDPKGMTAAHKTLPFGTRIRVSRPGGPSVVVRVNDRCGCPHGRIVDLSEAAAGKLNMLKAGVVAVRLEVLR